ncbi:hypothetical protein [Streptomyces sp. AK08-01B]|uniref:hypothetical protein n=1 Tax=unclassified Streptomyces TaxID=2593676 RepID=UPI0039F57603
MDSTTARALHDAAGMRLASGVLDAMEKATEEEGARSKGAYKRNKSGRAPMVSSSEDASGVLPAIDDAYATRYYMHARHMDVVAAEVETLREK